MPKEKNLASIYIGSTSMIMLLAHRSADGSLTPINEFTARTDLAREIDRDKALSDDGVERTIAALKEMRLIAAQEGVAEPVITVSEKIRKAVNRTSFFVLCHQITGTYPQQLNGKDQARLSFIGSISQFPPKQPILLIDMGGNQTEIAYGDSEKIVGAHSIDLGYLTIGKQLRFKERLNTFDNRAIKNAVRKVLLPLKYEISAWVADNKPLLLVTGGTAITSAALDENKSIYDLQMVEARQSSSDKLMSIFKKIYRLKTEQRAKLPGVDPARAHVIHIAMLTLNTLVTFFDFHDFKITANDLRLGVLIYNTDSRSRRSFK